MNIHQKKRIQERKSLERLLKIEKVLIFRKCTLKKKQKKAEYL
jgi:hypothetical protein